MSRQPPRILAFPGTSKAGITYLIPCYEYSVLVYCTPKPECNAFEQAIIDLARLGCCDTQQVAKNLCLDTSLVHFIQKALAQRGILDPVSMQLSDEGSALVKGAARVQPVPHAVSLLVEAISGSTLSIVFDGPLPSWQVLNLTSVEKCEFIQSATYVNDENRTVEVDALQPTVQQNEITLPTAAEIAGIIDQLNRKIKKGMLKTGIPVLRTAPDTQQIIQHSAETGRLCYLPLRLYIGSDEHFLSAENPFFRGDSQEMLRIVRKHPQFELYYHNLLHQMQETGHSNESRQVPGFQRIFPDKFPNLAAKLVEMQSKDYTAAITSAYSALEWGLDGLLDNQKQRSEAVTLLRGPESNRRQRLKEACERLHLEWPGKNILHNLPENRLEQYATVGSPPVLEVVLAYNILTATLEYNILTTTSDRSKSKFRKFCSICPEFLNECQGLKTLRNPAAHRTTDSTQQDKEQTQKWCNRVTNIIQILYEDYRDHATNQASVYKRSDKQLKINAIFQIFERIGFPLSQQLESDFPRAYEALIQALKEEEVQHYNRAVNELASAIQVLIFAQYCHLRRQKNQTDCQNLSKESLAEKCKRCGWLGEDGMPASLATVSERRYKNVLEKESNPSLGAVTLALLTVLDEPDLQSTAPHGGPRLLTAIAKLCDLRGHGNSCSATKEEWIHIKDEIFTTEALNLLLFNILHK